MEQSNPTEGVIPAEQAAQLPPHSDDVEEELRRIILALDAVFCPGSTSVPSSQWYEQRQLADMYLTSFQCTTVSWMVCDRLLQEPPQADNTTTKNDVIIQQRRFFAAQTLHTKCRSAIHELPQTALSSLRDSLLDHLRRYSMTFTGMIRMETQALTTRLAMCVSALAVQMSWTTILVDLLQPLINSGEAQQTSMSDVEAKIRTVVATSILRVLPEENISDRLVLYDENFRYNMRDQLVATAPGVFQFLYATLINGAAQPEQVLQAFHTWIRYVPVRAEAISETPLLQLSVDTLMQAGQCLEVATDVIVEIYRMYPSNLESNEGLVQRMIPLLSKLPLEQALQSNDEDVLTAYCRVVTEMGESYMSWILSQQHKEASQIVEWVLKCSSISEISIASITLHFWYRMVMDLETIDPYDWRQELVDFYAPHLLRLIDTCTAHLMRYPPDVHELPEDRIDDIHLDRFYVGETIEDCCRLLGGQLVLQRIGSTLKQECEKAKQNNTASTNWEGIESCLACIHCMNKFVPSDEKEFIPFCFQLIPQLPPDIPRLRLTASQCIGKFASWLVANPILLQPLMPYLAKGLEIKEVAAAAAVGIRELCECSNRDISFGEPVLNLYQEITHIPDRLDLNDELQILEGVCRALSRQYHDAGPTDADATVFYSRIVQPIGTRLTANVNNPNAGPRQIIPEVERLTKVVQHLVIPTTTTVVSFRPHPTIELLQSIWELLDGATTRFPNDSALAEKVCRLHKHALRSCGTEQYVPMFDRLLDVLIRGYERSHQSPFLYAASIVVTEFGKNPKFSERLYLMISAMANTSFTFLRDFEDLTRHPDVVEELFYLMGRMMTYCPDPLITSPLLQSMFQCAAVGMQLAHRDANKGTFNFLENTVSYGLSLRDAPTTVQQNDNNNDKASKIAAQQASLEHVLTMEGQKIVHNIARALVGDFPIYSNQLSELLWKLKFLCPQLLVQWLTVAFTGEDGPSNGVAANFPSTTRMVDRQIPYPPLETARVGLMSALGSDLPREDFYLAVRAFMNACERDRKFQSRGAEVK